MVPGAGWHWPDPSAGRLEDALRRIVCDELRPGDSDAPDTVIEPFLTAQVVRFHDPHTFAEVGSFGHELRSRASPDVVTAAADAYRARVEALSSNEATIAAEVSAQSDHYTFTDAVFVMVEHGALGIAHRLLPGLPSTALGHQPAPRSPSGRRRS